MNFAYKLISLYILYLQLTSLPQYSVTMQLVTLAGDYVSQQTHSIHKRGSFPFNIRLHSLHLNKLSRESNNLNLFHIQAKDLQQSFVHKPPVLSNEMLILASCAGVWRGESFIYSVASMLYTGDVWWDQVKYPAWERSTVKGDLFWVSS